MADLLAVKLYKDCQMPRQRQEKIRYMSKFLFLKNLRASPFNNALRYAGLVGTFLTYLEYINLSPSPVPEAYLTHFSFRC